MPDPILINCLQVNRDEDIYEESPIADTFVKGKSVLAQCNAIILIPGKALVGLVALDSQEVEDKVPFVSLLSNDYKHLRQVKQFVRAACQGRGPFASTVQTLQTGGKVPQKKLFTTGSVSVGGDQGRDSQPITAHLIVLEEPIEMQGETAIQY